MSSSDIFSRKVVPSRFGFRLDSAEGAEAHLHQAMPFREALRWRAMLRSRFNVGGDAVSGVFSTRNPSNCESLRKRGVSRVFRRPFPFVLLAAFFKLGKRWLSSLPRCGNPPPLAPRQQSGGFHVERDAVCKEVRLCRMGDGTIIRPLCCPCLRALASRQKLFWRRSGKSFVMPAFTPCLQKPLPGAFGRRSRQRYWAFGRRDLRCGANRFLADGRLAYFSWPAKQ